ncbi:hypothetical protein D3C80_1294880 [compost metagenome]
MRLRRCTLKDLNDEHIFNSALCSQCVDAGHRCWSGDVLCCDDGNAPGGFADSYRRDAQYLYRKRGADDFSASHAGSLIRAVRRYCIGWSRSTLDTVWSVGVTGNSEPGFGAGSGPDYYAGSSHSCRFLHGRNMGYCRWASGASGSGKCYWPGDIHYLWRRGCCIRAGCPSRGIYWRRYRMALGIWMHGTFQRAGAGTPSFGYSDATRWRICSHQPVHCATE